MPTTRSRSRATKGPLVEKVEWVSAKQSVKDIHEELDHIHSVINTLLDEHNRLVDHHNDLLEDHNNLWDWHKRHVDHHNGVRDKLDEPLPFGVKVWCFLLGVAQAFYPPLLLLSAVWFLF